MRSRTKERLRLLINIIILCAASIAALIFINRTGSYPWGSDTYGHLYKGNILYDSIKNGRWFLNYDAGWYNGIQPYRYWAPLPYYFLALINLISGNIIITYNTFVLLVFIIGGTGWLFFGYYTKRQGLALVISILWFIVPNNIRILFSEGNLPFVTVNMLVPYVILMYYRSINEKRIRDYFLLAVLMGIITLEHAMLSAMLGLSLFILSAADSYFNKRYMENFIALVYAFLGIMMVSFWLYPAFKGGILSMDSASAAEVMKQQTFPLYISLNPMLRLSNIEVYYYGAAFAALSVFGLIFAYKKDRAPFFTSLIILAGTTKAALPLIEKLPFNQLFWMRRFTTISMAIILAGLLLWGSLRKSIVIILTLLLIADSSLSLYVLGHNGQYPLKLSKALDTAASISCGRVAVLDSSSYGSFSSYHLGYNSIKPKTGQVYGWAWQGATTASNIVMLNTALETGYYGFMFDRALELGADVLLVKKNLISSQGELQRYADQVGYVKYQEDSDNIIYRYAVNGSFGTKAVFQGIAIGRYSSNAIYIFPDMESGISSYIDDYSYDSLRLKKTIFLSGFKFHDKQKAEELLKKLSNDGVRVVIDITGLDSDFLGVRGEPITIYGNYGGLYYKNQKLDMIDFPRECNEWRTSFLGGVKNDESYEVAGRRKVQYIGAVNNDNLLFIGLNIPYYAFLTKDDGAIKIMSDILNMSPYELPVRKLQNVTISMDGDIISIAGGDPSGTIIPIAALDGFKIVSGNYEVRNNLIYLKSNRLDIKIVYPYLKTGIMLSSISTALIILLSVYILRRRKIVCRA